MKEFIKYLKLVFFTPSIILFAIYFVITIYSKYKKGNIDIRNRVELYKEMGNMIETKHPFIYHFSFLFWIIVLITITF